MNTWEAKRTIRMRVTSKKIFPRRVSICIFKTEEKAEDYGFSRILRDLSYRRDRFL